MRQQHQRSQGSRLKAAEPGGQQLILGQGGPGHLALPRPVVPLT